VAVVPPIHLLAVSSTMGHEQTWVEQNFVAWAWPYSLGIRLFKKVDMRGPGKHLFEKYTLLLLYDRD
jgi:hypothetical protein